METTTDLTIQRLTTLSLERLRSYDALPAKRFEDVFAAQSNGMRGIGGISREFGQESVLSVLIILIAGLQKSFNVTNTMSEYQIRECCDLILSEYNYLTPADFKVFSDGVKLGKYGTSFNRIDTQVVMDWMKMYVKERFEAAEYWSNKAHKQLKEGEKMSPEQIAEFKSRFYSGADDLFQKIKANDEAPEQAEVNYRIWKEAYQQGKETSLEQEIADTERRLNDLRTRKAGKAKSDSVDFRKG